MVLPGSSPDNGSCSCERIIMEFLCEALTMHGRSPIFPSKITVRKSKNYLMRSRLVRHCHDAQKLQITVPESSRYSDFPTNILYDFKRKVCFFLIFLLCFCFCFLVLKIAPRVPPLPSDQENRNTTSKLLVLGILFKQDKGNWGEFTESRNAFCIIYSVVSKSLNAGLKLAFR